MSPEDSNNPGLNTKPDFSSVPLPEPAQMRSPYMPPSGTLGDIAENVSANNAIAGQQPTAIPTPGIIADDPNASSDAPAAPQSATESAPVSGKSKGKKLPLIIGLVALIAAVVGVAIFLLVAKPFDGGHDTGGDISASGDSFFSAKNLIISSDEKGATAYAIYSPEGEAITGFDYSIAPDQFIAGAALVKKNGEYGLIDVDGKEIVPFGDSDKIKAYGVLYGLTRDDKQILVNNKGEKVTEYTDDNVSHYSDYTGGKDAAYTIFRSDNHYTIYSPYGSKSAEFDSSSIPTVATPSFGEKGAQTIVTYSGGVIVLNDKGGVVRKLERNISKRFFGVFISKNAKVIGLSTVNEPVIESFSSITSPNDKRDNALIIDQSYYSYDSKDCAGLFYDDLYADDDESGYVACVKGYTSYPITLTGDVSVGNFSPITSRNTPTLLYLAQSIYPITLDSYGVMTGGSSLEGEFGILYKGKKKANFVSGNANSTTDDQKRTKTKTTIDYELFGMADGYIVNRIEKKTVTKYADAALLTPSGTTQSASGKIIFYDKKGEEICTFDKDGYYGVAERKNNILEDLRDVSRITDSSVTGFINGVAQVKKVGSDSFVNINTKCEIEDEKASYARTKKFGDVAVTTKKVSNGYQQELRDKQNKIIATMNSDLPDPTVTHLTDRYYLFRGKNKYYFVIGDKVAKEFDHLCVYGSGIIYTDQYVQFYTASASTACSDTQAVGGEHYYFLPNGKQFYYWKEENGVGR